MTFRIGTSGWQYDHWREVFYPRELPKRAWLQWYARSFDTVELNNSFYRQPKPENWDGWKATVPAWFAFSVKASRYISHFKRFADAGPSLKRLFDGAERLGDRLGPVLYQARADFERTPPNVERLEEFLGLLPPSRRHALEFRHDSWFGEETMEQLRRHGVAFCSYDMPDIECPLVATAGFGYVRFHGPVLYGGSYGDALLNAWAERLGALSRDVDDLWIYFNNDAQGFAVANALKLHEILT